MSETLSELDRISELPDEVKHQILSFLTITEAIATSFLSKAWKDEWLRVRSLDLGKKFFNEFMGEEEEKLICRVSKLKFFDYVDKVLEVYRNQALQKLHLYVPSFLSRYENNNRICKIHGHYRPPKRREFSSRVDTWLDYAIGCLKIKELSIRCYLNDYNFKYMYELPNHIMKGASCLTSLSLTFVKFDQCTIDTIASNCPLLEVLCFRECKSEISLLKLSGFNKLIKVYAHNRRSFISSRLEIDSRTLQTFSYKDNGSPLTGKGCEIDVASCSGLKNLKIYGSRLTDNSLRHHLSRLSKLQELGLEACKFLSCVKISNHGLEDLSLRNMENELVRVEIDAVNLKNFTYSQRTNHPLPLFSFKDFNSEKTTVSIGCYLIGPFWNDKVIEFLGQLDQCSRYLKTRAIVNYDASEISKMIYLEEQNSPPLMLLKHLTIHTSGVQPYAATVDDLLWIFPHLETVLVKSCPSPPRRTVLIKLKYRGDKPDDQENCGHCWWHQLLEVTIENIDGGEDCVASLKAFFENKRDSEKIIVHVVDKQTKSFVQEHKGCYTVRKDLCSVLFV